MGSGSPSSGSMTLLARGRNPAIHSRHRAWVPPWLAGLCLISWLGPFPDPDCSVCPTQGAANLALAIMALASRLADRMSGSSAHLNPPSDRPGGSDARS